MELINVGKKGIQTRRPRFKPPAGGGQINNPDKIDWKRQRQKIKIKTLERKNNEVPNNFIFWRQLQSSRGGPVKDKDE